MNNNFFNINHRDKLKNKLRKKMYERISTELFSNLIDKINQIPNYSTPYKENPSLKEPQKLFQILNLYNMDSNQKEIFSRIISHIDDSNLKQNLIKIMMEMRMVMHIDFQLFKIIMLFLLNV